MSVQKVAPVAEVVTLPVSANHVVVPPSIVTTPLFSANVTTMSAPEMSHPLSSTPRVPPSIVLTSASPSTSSHPHVSLDHIYTSNNADSLWGVSYKLEQKTLVDCVSL